MNALFLLCIAAAGFATSPQADNAERQPTTRPAMWIEAEPPTPSGTVGVTKHPPTYDVLAFDVDAPPTDYAPDLERRAYTEWEFVNDAWFWTTRARAVEVGEGWQVLLRVDRMAVELWLHTELYLPPDGPDAERAAAFEQARWELAEANYATADEVARRAANRVIGNYFSGWGNTLEQAEANARGCAFASFTDLYRLGTRDRALEAEMRLDEAADFGRKDVTMEQAKRLAALAALAGDAQEAYEAHLPASAD